jgi:hypothetical protein
LKKKVSIKNIKKISKPHTSRKYRSASCAIEQETFWKNNTPDALPLSPSEPQPSWFTCFLGDITGKFQTFKSNIQSPPPDKTTSVVSLMDLPSDVLNSIISHVPAVGKRITQPEVEEALNVLIEPDTWRVLSTSEGPNNHDTIHRRPSSTKNVVKFKKIEEISIRTRIPHQSSTQSESFQHVAPYINSKLFNQYLDRWIQIISVTTLQTEDLYDTTIAFITQILNYVLCERDTHTQNLPSNQPISGYIRGVEKRFSLIHQTLKMIDDDLLTEYILENRAGDKINHWEHFRDIRLRREKMKRKNMREIKLDNANNR